MFIKKIFKYIFFAVILVGKGIYFYFKSKFYNMYEYFINIMYFILIYL